MNDFLLQLSTEYPWVKWIFSGIGVFLIAMFINFFARKKTGNNIRNKGDNNVIVQDNKGDVKINK